MTLFQQSDAPPASLVGDPIVLHAYGQPIPKGSKSAVVRNGRAHVIESKSASGRRKQEDWKRAVTMAAQGWRDRHPGPAIDAPVTVVIDFYLDRPQSTPKRVCWPSKKPDVDKLTRLVLDCLNGVIYADDARVVRLLVSKNFAVDRPAGCTITIGAIE